MRTIGQYYRRIKRLIQFIPHIWRGWDFDYRTSVDLFKYQLGRTADFLESDQAYSSDAKLQAQKIRTAIKLIDKVYEEEYALEYQDQLKEIYGPNVLDWWFEDTGRGDGSSYLKYEYEKWDIAEAVNHRQSELFKDAHLKQERAHRILWRYIEHNIRGWWD